MNSDISYEYCQWLDFSVCTKMFYMWPWPWSLTYLSKFVTLLITCEQWVLELWYFRWVFLMIRPLMSTIIFYTMTLTLEFDLLYENLNLANIFGTVSARVLIFHMSLLVARLFRVYQQFWPCDLDLGVWLTFEYFNLINNIWIMSARALLIHMSIPVIKSFCWYKCIMFRITQTPTLCSATFVQGIIKLTSEPNK